MTTDAAFAGPADSLWRELSRFQVGSSQEHGAFIARLAREQGWSIPDATQAFIEYLRFIYLAATSPVERTPSQKVDEVWHLHLTYPESYERDLCQGVLRRSLPHEVGERGREARLRYRQQYENTIAAYRVAFKGAPPADFWPEPGQVKRRLNATGRALALAGGAIVGGPLYLSGAVVAGFVGGLVVGFGAAALLRQSDAFSEAYVAQRMASSGGCGSGCGGGSSSDSGGGGDGGSGCGGGGCGGGGD